MSGQTTVVSAFYPLEKSKHTSASYWSWIANFLSLPCKLVVFTSAECARRMNELRGELPMILIVRPFDSYEMTSPTMMQIWEKQHDHDPEQSIHAPALYAIWAMKQECVRIATEMNPFDSHWFVWCDIGIHRDVSNHAFFQGFPSKVPDVCVPGRLCVFEVVTIPDEFVRYLGSADDELMPKPPQNAIGGGCLAGDVEAWRDFGKAYGSTLRRMIASDQFAGKDQTVYFNLLITKATTKPFRIIRAKRFSSTEAGNHWMSGPVILGGNLPADIDLRFENVQNGSTFLQLRGGLGNQLFQIAAALSHAWRHGKRIVISTNTLGSRSTYWTSFLVSCAKWVGAAPERISKPLHETQFSFKPIPADVDALHGYFQSAKYFNDVAPYIRHLFQPAQHVRQRTQERYAHILSTIDVEPAAVVHVRRGDYVNNVINEVVTAQYYNNAIRKLRETSADFKFFVMSDDIGWCRDQPCFSRCEFVDEADECVALHLMSRFKWFIISNSTFSWWAAWLSTNTRMVIAPDPWFPPKGPSDFEDIFEPGWIKIPPQ